MMCLTPGHVDAAAAAGGLGAGRAVTVAVAACAGAPAAQAAVARAFGGHHGGRRQHARHGAHRLLAGLAQRLQGGAAGRIDIEGDGNMAAAGGDAAHHAQRHDALAGRRVDDGFENACGRPIR